MTSSAPTAAPPPETRLRSIRDRCTAVPTSVPSWWPGLLGIFVGGFGIHNFYLGNISIGVIQIIVTLVTCGLGSLWGFIEGILILCDRITVDGEGKPLAP